MFDGRLAIDIFVYLSGLEGALSHSQVDFCFEARCFDFCLSINWVVCEAGAVQGAVGFFPAVARLVRNRWSWIEYFVVPPYNGGHISLTVQL